MFTGLLNFDPVLSEKCSTVSMMHGTTVTCTVCKRTTVVGNVPRKTSAVCYVFLGKTGTTVTGPRPYSHNLVWKICW